ncbi:MAG: DUF2065 domain-containing protein [Thiolinea sp.]
MSFSWGDLINALALLLILEGLMPFITPRGMKKTCEQLLVLPEKTLRMIGFASIIAGILLLFLTD